MCIMTRVRRSQCISPPTHPASPVARRCAWGIACMCDWHRRHTTSWLWACVHVHARTGREAHVERVCVYTYVYIFIHTCVYMNIKSVHIGSHRVCLQTHDARLPARPQPACAYMTHAHHGTCTPWRMHSSLNNRKHDCMYTCGWDHQCTCLLELPEAWLHAYYDTCTPCIYASLNCRKRDCMRLSGHRAAASTLKVVCTR